ncbi:hypothetical protein C2S52_012570 [Perilla frutescens var. hirtella]|nr:hypothetical protein C2S52_012570 [Perilla frutescens var. hirtella]
MAQLFTLVKNLERGRRNYAMKLRLIHRYEVPSFGNKANILSLECVFHDNEIHFILYNLYVDCSLHIIGRVVSRCSLQTKDLSGRATKLIDIVLEDFNHVRLPCTLWGVYADEVVSFLDDECNDPTIIILQFCRAKTYKGEVGVSNAFNVTKMMVNPNVKEMEAFKKGKVHGVENNFTCQKCNLDEVSRHLRFKFAVLVEDNTGHLNLLLWNKECLQLLGKTASEISQTREADLNEIPPEIENLVDRTALFKIQVKDEQLNKGPYTVLSLTCDEGVISNFPGFKELNEKVLSSDATTPTISKRKSKVITLDDLTEDDYLKRTGDAEISSAALLKKPKLTIKEEKQE